MTTSEDPQLGATGEYFEVHLRRQGHVWLDIQAGQNREFSFQDLEPGRLEELLFAIQGMALQDQGMQLWEVLKRRENEI